MRFCLHTILHCTPENDIVLNNLYHSGVVPTLIGVISRVTEKVERSRVIIDKSDVIILPISGVATTVVCASRTELHLICLLPKLGRATCYILCGTFQGAPVLQSISVQSLTTTVY